MKADYFKQVFKEHFEYSNDIELSLQKIKIEGASIIDSISAIKSALSLSLNESELLVVNSITWSQEMENGAGDIRSAFLDYIERL